MEKEEISIKKELQDISNNARKSISLTDSEYDETDGRMIWLCALLNYKLRKLASKDHHEVKIKLFEFFREIDHGMRIPNNARTFEELK